MALIFMDGFDHYPASSIKSKWDVLGNAVTIYPTDGRDGAGMVYLTVSDSIRKDFTTASDTIIAGFAMYKTAPGHSEDTNDVFRIYNGSSTGISIVLSNFGIVSVERGGTLVASSSYVPFQSSWAYFEIKVVYHDTTGSVEVRVNGQTVINETGIDTMVNTDSPSSVLFYGGGAYGNPIKVDDFYLCDGTGTKNNDFLGDSHVTTLYPVSDGTYSDFTPSTGTDHYALVDDPSHITDSEYVSSDTVGDIDTFDPTTIALGEDVHGVQVSSFVKNLDAGELTVRPIIRSGATPANNEGPDLEISQTLKSSIGIWDKEPTDDVNWTEAKINAAEFGLKVQS